MSEHSTPRNHRRLRRSFVILLMSMGSVGTLLASAVFTDTAQVGANTVTTGTIDIATSPTSAVVSFSGMAPGDKVTGAITISNSGSLQLRYAIKSTTSEAVLAAQLDLTVKSGVSSCTNADFAASGTVLFGPGDLGTTGGTTLIGDVAQGDQAGDRTLNASSNEVLCYQVVLPTSASNTVQNLSDTATFDFVAEQTTNN